MGESVPVKKTESDSAGSGGKKPDAGAVGVSGGDTDEAKAAAKFLADLVARGEAVEADKHSTSERDERPGLPPGVTHEIVPGKDGEAATVRRRRFSAF